MSTIATIDLTQGDNLPLVTCTLTDTSNGFPIDVSQAQVTVYFRAVGAVANPDGTPAGTPLPCTNVTNGTDGVVQFYFVGDCTKVPPGLYEGLVQIVQPSALRMTVKDKFSFRVRPA
jgi:hypothetical protein